MKTNLGQKRAK